MSGRGWKRGRTCLELPRVAVTLHLRDQPTPAPAHTRARVSPFDHSHNRRTHLSIPLLHVLHAHLPR